MDSLSDPRNLYSELLHQDNARAAGLRQEHYWANGTQGSPKTTAAFIKATGQVLPGEDFWWDIEPWTNPSGRIWTPDEVIAHKDELAALFKPVAGQGIYLNLGLANDGDFHRTGLKLWLAAYTDAAHVLVKGGWRSSEIVYWQFTSDGTAATREIYGNILDVNRSGKYVWDVAQLQTALNSLGASLVVDNDFGGKTESAVKVFQRSVGLDDDGDPGPLTLTSLSDKLDV